MQNPGLILQFQRGLQGFADLFHHAAFDPSQPFHEPLLVHGEELGAVGPAGRGEACGLGLGDGDVEDEGAAAGGEGHDDGGSGAGRVIAEIRLEDDRGAKATLLGTAPGLEVQHPDFTPVAGLQGLAHLGLPALPLAIDLGFALGMTAPWGPGGPVL